MTPLTSLERTEVFSHNRRAFDVEATETHASARGSHLPNPPSSNRKSCASEQVEASPLHLIRITIIFIHPKDHNNHKTEDKQHNSSSSKDTQ